MDGEDTLSLNKKSKKYYVLSSTNLQWWMPFLSISNANRKEFPFPQF